MEALSSRNASTALHFFRVFHLKDVFNFFCPVRFNLMTQPFLVQGLFKRVFSWFSCVTIPLTLLSVPIYLTCRKWGIHSHRPQDFLHTATRFMHTWKYKNDPPPWREKICNFLCFEGLSHENETYWWQVIILVSGFRIKIANLFLFPALGKMFW